LSVSKKRAAFAIHLTPTVATPNDRSIHFSLSTV